MFDVNAAVYYAKLGGAHFKELRLADISDNNASIMASQFVRAAMELDQVARQMGADDPWK